MARAQCAYWLRRPWCKSEKKRARRLAFFTKTHYELEGKYSLESTDPRESEIRAHLRP